MALFRLEDLLAPRKEAAPVLDLAGARPTSQSELDKLLQRVPEFRIKPEKVRNEDMHIIEEFIPLLCGGEKGPAPLVTETAAVAFPYGDPCPASLSPCRLSELAALHIHWRMLTTARPRTKLEEEYFSRLVDLEKLKQAAVMSWRVPVAGRPRPQLPANQIRRIVRTHKSGVSETRLKCCSQCGEELCGGGACTEWVYDLFLRQALPDAMDSVLAGTKDEDGLVGTEGVGGTGIAGISTALSLTGIDGNKHPSSNNKAADITGSMKNRAMKIRAMKKNMASQHKNRTPRPLPSAATR